jgi:hypothetical protein
MRFPARRAAILTAIFTAGLMCQGCLAVAAGGAVVGATGAVVGGTAHAVGAVGSAVIPGESKKQRAKRLEREERDRERARRR